MKVCYFGNYDEEFTKNKYIIRSLELNGVEVLTVHNQIPTTSMNTKGDFSILSLLNRILSKFEIIPIVAVNFKKIKNCDAILIGYPGHFDVPFAFLISRLCNIPVFFDPVLILSKTFSENVKVFPVNSFPIKLIRFIEGMLYGLPDLIFVETEFAKKLFQKYFNIPSEKIKIVYVGADDRIYRKSVEKKNKKKFIVTYYGLFIHIHGVEVILKAASLLLKYPDIEFQLVGKGLLYDEMYELAKKLKLNNVVFLPEITEKTSFPVLSKSDVFLGFLADSEIVRKTIPNKVYQGLALGKAVLTADTQAMRKHFKHLENVYLIHPENPLELANAILHLKRKPALRSKISKAGYSLFNAKFSPKSQGMALVNYMKNYIENRTLDIKSYA